MHLRCGNVCNKTIYSLAYTEASHQVLRFHFGHFDRHCDNQFIHDILIFRNICYCYFINTFSLFLAIEWNFPPKKTVFGLKINKIIQLLRIRFSNFSWFSNCLEITGKNAHIWKFNVINYYARLFYRICHERLHFLKIQIYFAFKTLLSLSDSQCSVINTFIKRLSRTF